MKIAKQRIGETVDRPDPGTRFYLMYGPDTSQSRALGERLLAALGAEKFQVSSASVKDDPASLPDEAGAMALFGGPRAIWIEPAGDEIAVGVDALLEAATCESPVIAIAGALRKTSRLVKISEAHRGAAAIASYLPEGRDALSMVLEVGRSEGLIVDASVADRVAGNAGNDRGVVVGEMTKFALYLGASPDHPVELTHDVIDKLGADSAGADRMRLGDLALTGEGRELLEELERGGLAANEAISVIRSLQRRLMQVAPMRAKVEAGESVDGVMTSAGRSLFWKDKKAVGKMLRIWNLERLATMVERSADLEKGIMLGDEPPLAALGEELVTIARVAQRRR